MNETVVALFDDFATSQRVVEDLVDAGYSRDDISLVANDSAGEYTQYVGAENVTAGQGAGFGAIIGTLTGLGVALIPGVGPVLAAGPLAAALFAGVGAAVGAATGGLVAGLV
jgi:predicted N-acetyltransferase YhbS